MLKIFRLWAILKNNTVGEAIILLTPAFPKGIWDLLGEQPMRIELGLDLLGPCLEMNFRDMKIDENYMHFNQ